MSLTIDQLFIPAPSGVGLNPNQPPAVDTWLFQLLSTCQSLGLPTTSWQPGGPERTILSATAVCLAMADSNASLTDQGGFLDFAASGTVTYVAINGQSVTSYVTPDPSIPSQNPDGALGWLDLNCQSYYETFRIEATYASGPLAIANTSGITVNEGAGAYHVSNTNTGATYNNTLSLTIPPSAIAGTGGVVTGVVVGIAGTTIATQTAHGLSPGNTVYLLGILGVNGLAGVFAQVVTTPTPTTFTIAVSTSGAWSGGGQVYLCTIGQMQADARGLDSNAAPGEITTTITQNAGVVCKNLTAWGASNYESNTAYVARTRLSLAAKSPNGPSQAYAYFALTAQQILANETPPVTLTNGAITKALAFSNPQTRVVTTLVSSATPASTTLGQPVTPGCAQLGITGATNATPIQLSTITPHGLITGNQIVSAGILGNTAANGGWTITVTGASTFTLDGSAGNGAYTGGGSLEGGDLGQIDNLIQNNVVPDGITAITQSALAFPVTVVATVVVPQAYLATYTAAAPGALAALLATYPIGGNVPPGGSAGTIPFSAITGALIDAGVLTPGAVSYVRQVSNQTVNGGAVDLDYPAPQYVAQLAIPTIQVIGV